MLLLRAQTPSLIETIAILGLEAGEVAVACGHCVRTADAQQMGLASGGFGHEVAMGHECVMREQAAVVGAAGLLVKDQAAIQLLL